MKEDIEEILRLHNDFSTRFNNYVLKSLIEENGDKQNMALSPSRLQAVLLLLANWTTPNNSRWILDQTVSDVIDIKEANLLFNSDNIQPVPHEETFRDMDGILLDHNRSLCVCTSYNTCQSTLHQIGSWLVQLLPGRQSVCLSRSCVCLRLSYRYLHLSGWHCRYRLP